MPPHPLGKGGMRMAAGMNKLGWHWWPGTQAIPSWNYKSIRRSAFAGAFVRPVAPRARRRLSISATGLTPRRREQRSSRVRAFAKSCSTDQGRASGVIWIDREGTEHRQRGKAVVLAANGIGKYRLLLLSKSRHFRTAFPIRRDWSARTRMLHPNNEVLGLYEEEIESWKGPAGQGLDVLAGIL